MAEGENGGRCVVNARPISAIYRALSAAYDELAERMEDAEQTLVQLDAPKTRAKRATPVRVVTRPEGESDDLAAMRAKQIMRRSGFTEVKR